MSENCTQDWLRNSCLDFTAKKMSAIAYIHKKMNPLITMSGELLEVYITGIIQNEDALRLQGNTACRCTYTSLSLQDSKQ